MHDMKKTSLLFAVCSTLFVSACALQTTHRGYIFPDDLDAQVSGIKTTADLNDRFGSPMAKTIYGDPVWIYYGADENYNGPFPLTWDNRTALLAWVSGDKVVQTKILRDSDFPDVEIDSDTTPIPAEIRLNALQELVNNVGRFTPAGMGQ